MEGLTAKVKEQSELETVASLRKFTEQSNSKIDNRLSDAGSARQDLKKDMLSEIKAVDAFTQKFNTDYNSFKDGLLYTKTCATNCFSEEDGVIQVYKNFVLEESKPMPMGD
jgi:hypothetical protein